VDSADERTQAQLAAIGEIQGMLERDPEDQAKDASDLSALT
jgi:hypothetical protein